MPWVGTPGAQTFQRTDGTRTGTQVWQQADAASVDIVAPDHDLHDQDIANGLQQALKKDGGNSASANIPMGGFRFTNLGAASARNSSVNTADVQDGRLMFCTVSGTRNAITLTPPIDISSYIAGQTFRFIPTDNNTGAVTVAISGLAAKAVKVNGTDLTPGQILAGSVVTITFDGTDFEMNVGVTPAAVGVGSVVAWPLATIPPGWLECDGSAISRTDYAALYSVLGTAYGAGDGSSTFNLPNYKDYFLRGFDVAGTDASSRTNRGDGTTGANVGTKQSNQVIFHNHPAHVTDPGHIHTFDGGSNSSNSTGGGVGTLNGPTTTRQTNLAFTGISVSIDSVGGSETRPKNITVKWIILATPSAAMAILNNVGDPGWSPVLAAVEDGSRKVFQVTDWVGGSGTKPDTGDYVGATGFVANIADAIDIGGIPGDDGWSPEFAIASDGDRRVLQVADWTGGSGTKPATGQYVGSTGLVDLIADGIDIRGLQGLQGPALIPTGDYNAGTAYAEYDVVLDQGSSWVALQATTGNAPPTLPTTSNAYWQLLAQKGTDGAGAGDVVGPASATDSAIVLYDGVGGKLIKDSAKAISTDGTFASNSDAKVPTEKAVKTYVDTALPIVPPSPPQGRLTLTSASAITTGDVTAAATIYYTPAGGLNVPLYDGSKTAMKSIGAELSLALDSNSGHTGYHQSGKNFDLFVFDDSGTKRLGSSPTWNSGAVAGSDTARGTGAGSTELELQDGFLTNKNSIDLRWGASSGNITTVPAHQALFVGSFRTTADGTTEDSLTKRFLSNAYNATWRKLRRSDSSTTPVTYSTLAFQQFLGNTANQVEVLECLTGRRLSLTAKANGLNSTTTAQLFMVSIGRDSTNTALGGILTIRGIATSALMQSVPMAILDDFVPLGYHKYVWLHLGAGTDTQTWFTDSENGLTGGVEN